LKGGKGGSIFALLNSLIQQGVPGAAGKMRRPEPEGLCTINVSATTYELKYITVNSRDGFWCRVLRGRASQIMAVPRAMMIDVAAKDRHAPLGCSYLATPTKLNFQGTPAPHDNAMDADLAFPGNVFMAQSRGPRSCRACVRSTCLQGKTTEDPIWGVGLQEALGRLQA